MDQLPFDRQRYERVLARDLECLRSSGVQYVRFKEPWHNVSDDGSGSSESVYLDFDDLGGPAILRPTAGLVANAAKPLPTIKALVNMRKPKEYNRIYALFRDMADEHPGLYEALTGDQAAHWATKQIFEKLISDGVVTKKDLQDVPGLRPARTIVFEKWVGRVSAYFDFNEKWLKRPDRAGYFVGMDFKVGLPR
jgi:hypothetical protein